MKQTHTLPADIERTSMKIIAAELQQRGIVLPPEQDAVIRRVIHTTADFEYADTLRFTSQAIQHGVDALRHGSCIVTDTNMAKSGISKPSLSRLSGEAVCYMSDPAVAETAKQNGTTRAVASMEKAALEHPDAVFAIGNAPTALLKLSALMRSGLRPSLIIAVPVGFVNVEESKTEVLAVCEQYHVPAIVAMGRKGGSNVAAAICNALLYTAANTLDPSARGWQG